MANESELPSQAVTVFFLVIKEMCCVVFSQWKIKNFLYLLIESEKLNSLWASHSCDTAGKPCFTLKNTFQNF